MHAHTYACTHIPSGPHGSPLLTPNTHDVNLTINVRILNTCQDVHVSISVYQSISIAVYQYISISVYQYSSISVYQYIGLSVYQDISTSVYQYISISVYQYISISVYQYIRISVYQYFLKLESPWVCGLRSETQSPAHDMDESM